MYYQMNPLLCADSYKLSHFSQYPNGTEYIYSYIEARRSAYPVVILGIETFTTAVFHALEECNVNELRELAKEHGVPFNEEGWSLLLKEYEFKGLPLKIMGVPEGTVVVAGHPVAAIVNTDPRFPWLTSFFETLFLRCVWYPSTVASRSRYLKGQIKRFMVQSGADLGSLDFKLHDFGARGVSSGESAAYGGAGHLTQFKGSDTLEAVNHVRQIYGVTAGFSIPATEHSTVTSWGRAHEKDMYEALLRNNAGRMVACVSDSYNIWEALKIWKELEPLILEIGCTLVIRPDSGDPVTTPVQVVEILTELFGYTVNAKGFKVLPSYIRVIQGDGIDEESIVRIMQRMVDRHLSMDNLGFGMGGGLLQILSRDDCSFVMKCSAARVNGIWRDVYKDPIGGSKTSKKGIVYTDGYYVEIDKMGNRIVEEATFVPDGWVLYYNTDEHMRPYSKWEDICARAAI